MLCYDKEKTFLIPVRLKSHPDQLIKHSLESNHTVPDRIYFSFYTLVHFFFILYLKYLQQELSGSLENTDNKVIFLKGKSVLKYQKPCITVQ